MIELSTAAWVLLVASAMLIGIAKTALPGAATLAVATFAAVLPARESTAALLVLLLVGDLIAIWTYRRGADWGTLKRLVPAVLVGLVLGAIFLAWADDVVMRRTIGVILLVLTALTLLLMRRGTLSSDDALTNPKVRGFYGALGGFTTMAANSGGPVMTLYFLAARFNVLQFLATQAWFFFLVNVSKLPFSIGLGLLHANMLPMLAILAPIVILGAFIGRRIVSRMDKKLFDRIVIVLTILSSLYLLR
ncbi:sulfite exporter TauE/SafE family protein [Tessaracoccus caeni]|uniref:sulfite exporter TauE/SafE family protein n=1 Tax=Tessaracoccus caeni TaxID=3031239 RepID=UPI0023DC18F8|nr:sulfite exporter TauE/SafE family protein [Tessaracoccus caeni]MDF1488091.1 sulfite exporter TauE/SafE family protein [Tessaracoccus caeni]